MNENKRPVLSGGIHASITIALVIMVVAVSAAVIGIYIKMSTLAETLEASRGVPVMSAGMAGGTDGILLQDSVLGEIWIPILDGVKPSPYDENLFQREAGGFMQYRSDTVKTWNGIDVSFYQQEIDWRQVKASGIDFAMIRLGYRGYRVGNVLLDECFEANVEGALAAGLDVGVYFFSQATTVQEAAAEADFVLSYIQDYDIRYPVVFDWEVIYGNNARSDIVSVQTLTNCAKTFCDKIAAEGYTPMIYANKRLALLKYDQRQLQAYDFWLAEFSSRPSYYYDYKIWQYTERGRIEGIEGNVDLNISFVNYSER